MNLGIGVMIGILGGNEDTVNAVTNSLNKTIVNILLDNNELLISFEDGSTLILWDGGQSCCENRYMVTDDDLDYYRNSIFKQAILKEAPNTPDEWGDHEIQFLEIVTSKGSFICSNHNEHNGYYGGFYIQARLN